jgi:hypothetical protein
MKPNKANLNPFESHLQGQIGMKMREQSQSGGRQGREEDVEGQAVAGGAGGDEFALVGVDGFAGEEKFETDFLAVPAVVEGVKKFFEGVGFEALAVVVDDEVDVIAAGQHRVELGFERAAGQGEGDEAAAFMESLPAMEAEVEDDLLELGGIGVDPGATGVVAELEFDLVGDDAAQDLEAFFDDGGQREGLAVDGRALGKGAQFVEKFAGAVAGFKDLLEGFVGGVAFVDVHGGELGAAEDAGDDVVEFVGDAAGELVEGVEFLVEQKSGFIAFGRRRAGWRGMGERRDFGGEIRDGSISGMGLAGFHFDLTGGSVGSFAGRGDKKFSSEI